MSSSIDYVGQLIEAGATPIPDEEIIDRGTYFEWTGYTPDQTLALGEPLDVYYDYEHYKDWDGTGLDVGRYLRDEMRLRFYPKAAYNKPVRVNKMFYDGEKVVRLSVRRGDNAQTITTVRLTSTTRPHRVSRSNAIMKFNYPESWSEIKGLSALADEQRYYYMMSLTHMLVGLREGTQHRGVIESLFSSIWYRGIAMRRNASMFDGQLTFIDTRWLAAKTLRKQIGLAIADVDTDPEDMIGILQRWVEAASGNWQIDRMLDAWNKLHHDDTIERCTCGHCELSSEIVNLREGRTACRECDNNGNVVYVEDAGEHDLQAYAYYHDEDGLWYTYAEGETPEHGSIHSYYTNVLEYQKADPNIVTSPYGDFLMGIELEVVPNAMRYHAECVEDTENDLCDRYAILKHDGSLDDGGFEIVTAPRGLQEHIDRFKNWKPNSHLRAWDAGCCGMHVHIGAQAFTPGTLGKFIEFINSSENAQFILAIAGRHPIWDGQAKNYAAAEGDVIKGNPKKTCQYKSGSRYRMVNTTNLSRAQAQRLGVHYNDEMDRHINTVELRIFRASLKKERLLAQIEFAHAAVMFCRWSSMRELTGEHFIKWLQGMAGLYPNLAKWYGVKANTDKIIANPPVRAAAEV